MSKAKLVTVRLSENPDTEVMDCANGVEGKCNVSNGTRSADEAGRPFVTIVVEEQSAAFGKAASKDVFNYWGAIMPNNTVRWQGPAPEDMIKVLNGLTTGMDFDDVVTIIGEGMENLGEFLSMSKYELKRKFATYDIKLQSAGEFMRFPNPADDRIKHITIQPFELNGRQVDSVSLFVPAATLIAGEKAIAKFVGLSGNFTAVYQTNETDRAAFSSATSVPQKAVVRLTPNTTTSGLTNGNGNANGAPEEIKETPPVETGAQQAAE